MPNSKLESDNCAKATSGATALGLEASGGTKPAGQKQVQTAAKEERKPGELVFTLLIFAFGALGYYFAKDLSNDSYSAPSVFPKFASAAIMFGSLVSLFKSIRCLPPKANLKAWAYLMPQTVQGMLLLIILYCIALPWLHFVPASYIFMVASLMFLYKGRNFWRMCLYSAISVGCLVLLFRYVMLVILP